jgi:hypothetical protein
VVKKYVVNIGQEQKGLPPLNPLIIDEQVKRANTLVDGITNTLERLVRLRTALMGLTGLDDAGLAEDILPPSPGATDTLGRLMQALGDIEDVVTQMNRVLDSF